MLPNMIVINPCDYNQTKAATIAISKHIGPVYLRFGRPKVPNFTLENEEFIIGEAKKITEGNDVTILATGHLVWEAILAEKQLKSQGINAEVINIHTIKPLDSESILESVKKTRCVVTAEEHQINGGLGDSIAQLLSKKLPLPIEMVGVNDTFGESGNPKELMVKYGLTSKEIYQASLKVIKRK